MAERDQNQKNLEKQKKTAHLPKSLEIFFFLVKRTVSVAKCHSCHAKGPWMSPCATPATLKRRGATGDQRGPSAPPEPRLPRKSSVDVTKCQRLPRKRSVGVAKRHACHAKGPWMSPSATRATPSTQNKGQCHRVPRLPRKVPRRHGRPTRTKRHQSHARYAIAAYISGLPRKRNVDVAKRHATPATQSAEVVCVCVTKLCMTKLCMTKLCVCVCDKVVCERFCVTKMRV